MVLSRLLPPLLPLSPLFHLICETGLDFGKAALGGKEMKSARLKAKSRIEIAGEPTAMCKRVVKKEWSNLQDMEQYLLMFCEIKWALDTLFPFSKLSGWESQRVRYLSDEVLVRWHSGCSDYMFKTEHLV